ncbi:MAG: alpha/beta fold hydrolase [Planctomycetota bacterium]
MSLLSKIADRTILCPTTQWIDPGDKERVLIQTAGGSVEAWSETIQPDSNPTHQAILIKFPGTGGRAERSGVYPANLWDRLTTTIWTVNHRGWGGSEGPATLQNFTETCDAVWGAAKRTHPDKKVILYGNSLGCVSAIYLASRQTDVAGLYIRNPPPLHQMIATRPRYAWTSLGMSKWVANQIPAELDCIANAKNSVCPLLFLTSEKDRVVPPRYQDEVFENFSGIKKRFWIQGGGHASTIPDSQSEEYVTSCRWLQGQILKNRSDKPDPHSGSGR